MRITSGMITRHTQNYIQDGMQRMARYQEMISTTKKIIRLSDDPTATSQLLNVRSNVEMNKQYMRNIQDGLSYLYGADTALDTAGNIIKKAKDYALQAANDTLDDDDRKAVAEQIDKLIDEMKDIANTVVGGVYIFAGTRNSDPPFKFERNADNKITITYHGNLENVSREILDQTDYPINIPSVSVTDSASGLFGQVEYDDSDPPKGTVTGGVFKTLIDLRDRLMDDDEEGLQQSIGELEAQHDHILRYRVQVGARTNHFESVRDQLQDQELRLTQVISNLEDADMARVSVDLAQQRLVYQSSLASASQILQISLLHFLR
ncbi:flagellar hook-associated protein FlgL [Desulfallas thermosapovorans]|uniref:Flagellar hook-associated protein 3 FlgL n=1 Tax=Desulfallas thermosapovorans DSM 6562 TaxID=1121431 RepID=A0A5S4ZS07_9FIRM|nr:flagellar hook-associated protein FlgL [Desulfallas thermosapovorans]TYO95529.1 flagellar hook-associated protein 3 FlgL [Desulfallas thermosapovorans DSM 6562]